MSRARISSLWGKITVIVIICCCCLPAYAQYGGGSGEPNDPYLIFDANQMNAIGADSNDWDKHFLLCADIDLAGFTGTSFNIIGYYRNYYDNKSFTGVFDGSGHIISNFTYTSTGTSYIGLFGYVDDPNAEIKDLGLTDPNVDAGTGWHVGSLVGSISSGIITNCYVQGGSVVGTEYIGGLVGYNNYGTITNCYSTGSVTGISDAGGLVGWNWGTINNCYSTGDVSGDYSVGGLVGWSYGTITNCCSAANVSGGGSVSGLVGCNYKGTIRNCYSTGSVSGTGWYVGGLVGWNLGTITNCYSTGSVIGNRYVGGLVGSGYTDNVSNSFWDIEISGQSNSAGGTGKPTAEMQTMSTFTDAGWDFTTPVWTIDEGVDYPRLWWELAPVLHRLTPLLTLYVILGSHTNYLLQFLYVIK